MAYTNTPLTAPKSERKTKQYMSFVRQLYHACLARVFEPLRHGMTIPQIVRCPDGHLRKAVFGLGPYIADYPEQVYLSGIVQNWCPTCTASPEDLDGSCAIHRSARLHEFLVNNFDPGIVWEDYGVRSDIIVSITDHNIPHTTYRASSHSPQIFLEPTFTNCCRPTFYTKLSRGHSRTTLSPGSWSISLSHTENGKRKES